MNHHFFGGFPHSHYALSYFHPRKFKEKKQLVAHQPYFLSKNFFVTFFFLSLQNELSIIKKLTKKKRSNYEKKNFDIR